MSRAFHLGDLLSVTDGHLVSPNHINGVYDVIDYVTGVEHMTHQLPRAAGEVTPWLVQQHPWLTSISVPGGMGSKDEVMSWLAGKAAEFGEFHDVEAMPDGVYAGRDPIVELREMVPDAQIVEVAVPTRYDLN